MTDRTPFRILLADDHEVVRRGLRSIFAEEPGWEICGEAANGREAVDFARKLKPDLVIMDIEMPELNGLSATRRILKERPETEVLVLNTHDSEELVREALDAGARGFMLKSDPAMVLVAAVKAVLNHKIGFTSSVSEMTLRSYLKKGSKASQDTRLTAREQEILQLLAQGKSNKEVATVLRISVKTAETHRSHIMAKLNLHNLRELVLYAVRNHMVQP